MHSWKRFLDIFMRQVSHMSSSRAFSLLLNEVKEKSAHVWLRYSPTHAARCLMTQTCSCWGLFSWNCTHAKAAPLCVFAVCELSHDDGARTAQTCGMKLHWPALTSLLSTSFLAHIQRNTHWLTNQYHTLIYTNPFSHSPLCLSETNNFPLGAPPTFLVA